MTALTTPLPLSDDHPDELLSREITPPIQTDKLSLDETYEIERTKKLLLEGGFKTVALQFPDAILHDASEVSKRLQELDGVKTYILADTSYGSCCVDEVAAEHINADVVVHYGRAVTRLPVIYVFGRRNIDIESLGRQFKTTFPETNAEILLKCDTAYAHSLDSIFNHLISIGYTNTTKHPIPSTNTIVTPQFPTTTERLLPTMTSLPETTILLIAEPTDSTTTLLTYHHLTKQIYTFSPSSSTLTLSSPATNLALRRRYVAVQKARDAGTVGIIVGTLGKGGYLTLISLLRKMILDKGKKPYLLALGKINPAKVANFAECDVFCIIACPESTVVDSREYFKPIVTPYELYLALTAPVDGGPQWGTQWISDFERVMSLPEPDSEEGEQDIPHFSLVTGKLVYSETSRPMRVSPKTTIEYDTNEDGALIKRDTQVAVREDGSVAVRGVRTLAGERLIGRSWRGLDPPSLKEGNEEGAELEIGRDGVARAYKSGDSVSRGNNS